MDDRASKSRTQEINAYKKRVYKRFMLELKKADFERVSAAADAAGETVSGFIKRVLAEHIGDAADKNSQGGDVDGVKKG